MNRPSQHITAPAADASGVVISGSQADGVATGHAGSGLGGVRPRIPVVPAGDARPGRQSLRAYIDPFVADTLERCTRCGKCYEACPMTAYAPELSAAEPGRVVEGLMPLLQAAQGSSEAVAWVKICTQSAVCIDACPEGINAMLMLRVARMGALGSLGAEAQMNSTEDPQFFRKIEAFAATQLTPEEIQAWHRASPKERSAS